ncbi:cyclin-dependent kinases regulatory subunit 1-like [Trachypithecus francoisi]|uniref:cyclin-dependent kinases regulatory subunit 1-like n=1 Tax=Trachypithecus francoisi TaxID=54180 RepID=UPI00141AC676|nr:cyclin-dependent kinases regulatory subunit 1-like [Trachypithecus francoisi]
MLHKQIYYSNKYDDEEFEYRHVMLPTDIAKLVRKTHLMSESEWRNLGIQQSQGWVHYMIHEPECHILLFRRPLPKKPKKGSWQGAFQPQALHSCPYFLTPF